MLTVLCNSHSLQLLIGDLLKLPTINEVWQIALNIVNSLRNATKQYKYLQVEQVKEYGYKKALISTGKTRWGTQVGMLKSLYNSFQALRKFAINPLVEFEYTNMLLDIEFWGKITELLELLHPINEKQKMSEDNRATLATVAQDWAEIQYHLEQKANSTSFYAGDITDFLGEVGEDRGSAWEQRVNRQISDIHIVAYFLRPQNYDKPITDYHQDRIREVFQQYITDWLSAYKLFFNFREQRGLFSVASKVWEMVKDRDLFWTYSRPKCPELASFARRLLNTIANSMPSERAWSTMNYIHSKTRNRLSLERVNKLCFIYINTRTLRKINDYEPTDEELLDYEDNLIQALEGA
jgi:hypothetical protein